MTTLPERRNRPAGNRTASDVTAGDSFILGQTVEQFVYRLVTDCLNEATRSYWLRRARDFEDARPTWDDDYHGAAARDELREQWYRLTAIAQACRARAEVAPIEDIDPDVATVLREVW
jgi:hypothetical protein